MRLLLIVLGLSIVGCGAATPAPVEHTLPAPLFTKGLPDAPEDVPESKRMVVAVSECIVEGSQPPEKTPPGILMSEAMAMRAARLKTSYDELRGLYEVDLRTMDREREVYERYLKAADADAAAWQEKARRSWWEMHRGEVGLAAGIVVGVALTVGVVAAIDGVTSGIE